LAYVFQLSWQTNNSGTLNAKVKTGSSRVAFEKIVWDLWVKEITMADMAKEKSANGMAVGVSVGLAVGAVFGVLVGVMTGDIAVWLAVGIGCGMAAGAGIGTAMDKGKTR